MVRSIQKTNILIATLVVAFLSLITLFPVYADDTQTTTKTVDLEVNVAEILTVSLDEPATWATGTSDAVLRNKVSISANTNNKSGVTVSMYIDDTYPRLKNTNNYSASDDTTYINTLDANTYTYGTFPKNSWGYSVEDQDTAQSGASYLPMKLKADPIQLFSTVGTASVSTGSEDVFFGARADATKQSGTYAQTVYFVAVTGVIEEDPEDPGYNPSDPVTPSSDNPRNEIAQYNSTLGTTTYSSYSTTSGIKSTDTEISAGNQANTYDSYVTAAGVTSSSNNSLAGALAAAAAVTATSGTFFFILAKRRKDDDEEEEE